MKNNSLRNFSWRLIFALLLATTSLMAQQFIPPQNSITAAQRFALAGDTSQEEQPQKAHDVAANRSGGMTLEQLQQMALANNPTLAQAKAGVTAAAGRTLQAALWPNPTVGYVGEEVRGGSYGGGQHGVFIQQNVILGSKLDLDRKVRSEEGKQAVAEAEEQRLRVENGVRIAFYRSLAAQQMLETRKTLSGIAKDAVDTTQQLFNVGQADQPDLLQAQVEADEADLAVIGAEQDQLRAWRVLTSVVGKPAMELTALAGNLEDLPQINADEVIETILRDSPAVKIAQLESSRADLALSLGVDSQRDPKVVAAVAATASRRSRISATVVQAMIANTITSPK